MEWFKREKNSARKERSGASEWERMAQEERAEKAKRESTERQQRKIMGYFLSGENPEMMTANDVAVNEELKDAFLGRMVQGEFDETTESRLLRKIRGPIDTPSRGAGGERIFTEVMKDPWQKQLFSFCAGREVEDTASGGLLVQDFLAEGNGYATPVEFEARKEQIFDYLRPLANEEQMAHYKKSMGDLERALYGKRFEYHQAFEGLREESREKILAEAKIDGDAWVEGGQSYQLNAEMLREAGLGPEHQMKIDGRAFYMSQTFQLASGRTAALAYVPTEEGVKVRGYYKSNSQGVWRYMPDYVKAADSRRIDWFGKSGNEEALTLPFEMQAKLAEIERREGVKQVTTTNPDFLFAGVAKHYGSKDEYRQALRAGAMRGDYYREVSKMASENWFEAQSLQKRSPESLNLEEGLMPNFDWKMAEYESRSAMVGEMKVEAYAAKNGRFSYLMCSDRQGRSWVGGVETRSPITSTGLRRDWVVAGDLATPLYEYASQADGYGDTADARGPYLGMWQNYLSRVPLIRRYVERQRRTERVA